VHHHGFALIELFFRFGHRDASEWLARVLRRHVGLLLLTGLLENSVAHRPSADSLPHRRPEARLPAWVRYFGPSRTRPSQSGARACAPTANRPSACAKRRSERISTLRLR